MRLSILLPMIAMLTLGVGASIAGQRAEAKCVPPSVDEFRSISKTEIEWLISDIAKTNPKVLERFREDPSLKLGQLENLRELFAFASQAVKEGLGARAQNCGELSFIRAEVTAVAYDKEKNKGRPAMPPFGYITAAQISGYWGQGAANRTPVEVIEAREARFKEFLDFKVALLKDNNPQMADREITDEEAEQAREFFAKIDIYNDEYRKSTVLTKAFRDKVALQVKLQQAQFLSRLYNEGVASKVSASDSEVDAYIKSRPELDPAAKRSKAEAILKRAIAGEDFASLADEFTEDPGNNGDAGKKQGGLYADVKAGQMIEAFEKAALSLEPGKVHQQLTPTNFGYHIIKLEKKGFGGLTYDVRHILISTQYKDPDDPNAKEMPITDYVRSRIEEEKTRDLMQRLIVENAISVPDDFDIPPVAKAAPARRSKPRAKSPARRRN